MASNNLPGGKHYGKHKVVKSFGGSTALNKKFYENERRRLGNLGIKLPKGSPAEFPKS